MIAPGVAAGSPAVNRPPCVTAGRRGTRATPMTLLGHPAGLFLLFLVEMWERFSYYGMRGLLVLYLVQSTHPRPDATGFINPGRGWSRGDASLLYGWYTGLAYLLPIVGGWIADRLLGTHRSMVVGGLLIALGHLVLAVSGVGSLARTDGGMSVFVFGLALIVIGTGHFKPCVSVMVGQLYAPWVAPRRRGAGGARNRRARPRRGTRARRGGDGLGGPVRRQARAERARADDDDLRLHALQRRLLARLRAGGLQPEPLHRSPHESNARRLRGADDMVPVGQRGAHLSPGSPLRRALVVARPSRAGSRASGEDRARPRLLEPGLRLHGVGRPRRRRPRREGVDGLRFRLLLLALGGRALPLADRPLLRDQGRARALRIAPHGRVVHLDLPREPGRRARRVAGRGDRARRDRAPVASGRTGGLLHAVRGVGRRCRWAHLPPGSATRPARARGRLTRSARTRGFVAGSTDAALRLAGGRGCSAGRCGRPRAGGGSCASAARRSTGWRRRRAGSHGRGAPRARFPVRDCRSGRDGRAPRARSCWRGRGHPC